MLTIVKRHIAVGLLAAVIFVSEGFAYTLSLPGDLASEVLSESVPTAFAPADFEAADFTLEWMGPVVPGVQVRLDPESLMWVRVAEVLVVPRARMVVSVDGVETGIVRNAGFSQVLTIGGDGRGHAEMPVALISSEKNPIDLVIRRGGEEFGGRLKVRFQPRVALSKPPVYFDSSCSRFGLRADASGFEAGEHVSEWIYVGCRLVETYASSYRTSSLEAFVFWNGVGETIRIGGIETQHSSVLVWPVRLRASPGHIALSSGSRKVTLHYRIAEKLYFGNVGVGLGPYQFSFNGDGQSVSNWTIMPTFYVSYFITESMRLVAFDAITINNQMYTDFGIYLSSESIRTIDRRFVLNILLGGHMIGFRSHGQYFVQFGVPQGVEMIFNDFLLRGNNLTFGAFLYPLINGKAYDNVWVRFGSGKLFGEFNYISWREAIGSTSFYSRSVGLTAGFSLPFLRFL